MAEKMVDVPNFEIFRQGDSNPDSKAGNFSKETLKIRVFSGEKRKGKEKAEKHRRKKKKTSLEEA